MDEPNADHTIVSERARSDHRIPAPPSEHPAPPHAPGPTRPGEPPVRARTRGRRVLPWIVLILIVGAVAWALLRPRGTTKHERPSAGPQAVPQPDASLVPVGRNAICTKAEPASQHLPSISRWAAYL